MEKDKIQLSLPLPANTVTLFKTVCAAKNRKQNDVLNNLMLTWIRQQDIATRMKELQKEAV